jgi:carbon starvation protein
MIILLAVLALVVVKALAGSPWGLFTVAATLPIALLMGVYLRWMRPGRVGEASAIGVALLLTALVIGGRVAADPTWASAFTLAPTTLAWILIGYGFVASILPVWLLLAPRDYLSSFLKIGTILGLAIGIAITLPELRMPAVTPFIDGTGPVFAGSLFPFLFITIACGSVSGFHALIASGTTPKMIEDERQTRMIGYGAMLMESFVAIMALITACVLDPAVYFAMNAPTALIGKTAQSAAVAIQNWGFTVTPDALTRMAAAVGEPTILSRAGGAPTLAVGMAQIISSIFGGAGMAFWYHFAILFEALFILSTLDAGSRVGRFMIQDLLGQAHPALRRTESWTANLTATAICVAGWGWFLYAGVVDPLGGINTMWPLFGIANQMLAAIALIFATVVLFRMKRERYAWVAMMPTAWLLVCTLTAGAQKLFDSNPRIGFLAHARKYSDALAQGKLIAPAGSLAQMRQVIVNDWIDASLCALLLAVVVAMVGFGIASIRRARRSDASIAREMMPVYQEIAHAH